MATSWRGSEDGHPEPAWAGVCRPTSLEPRGAGGLTAMLRGEPGLGTCPPGPRFTWGAKALEQRPLKVAQHPCPRWAAGRRPGRLCFPSPAPTLHFQESFHCRCSGFKGCFGGLACGLLMQGCPPGWEDPGPSEHLRGRGASFPAVGGCVLVSLLSTCPCPPPGPLPMEKAHASLWGPNASETDHQRGTILRVHGNREGLLAVLPRRPAPPAH